MTCNKYINTQKIIAFIFIADNLMINFMFFTAPFLSLFLSLSFSLCRFFFIDLVCFHNTFILSTIFRDRNYCFLTLLFIIFHSSCFFFSFGEFFKNSAHHHRFVCSKNMLNVFFFVSSFFSPFWSRLYIEISTKISKMISAHMFS